MKGIHIDTVLSEAPVSDRADIESVLISEAQIQKQIDAMARHICENYEDVILLPILKGSMIFYSDLARSIYRNGGSRLRTETLRIQSYEGTESKGLAAGKIPDIRDGQVIVLEDIVDTGRTVRYIKDSFPRPVVVCSLLDKPSKRKVDIIPDINGFTIPDYFVVGYGMDHNERFRELPYIGVLRQ